MEAGQAPDTPAAPAKRAACPMNSRLVGMNSPRHGRGQPPKRAGKGNDANWPRGTGKARQALDY